MVQIKEESFTNVQSNRHVNFSNGQMHQRKILHTVDHDQELVLQHRAAIIKIQIEIIEMMEAIMVNVRTIIFSKFVFFPCH